MATRNPDNLHHDCHPYARWFDSSRPTMLYDGDVYDYTNGIKMRPKTEEQIKARDLYVAALRSWDTWCEHLTDRREGIRQSCWSLEDYDNERTLGTLLSYKDWKTYPMDYFPKK